MACPAFVSGSTVAGIVEALRRMADVGWLGAQVEEVLP
jgi:hypothetical protein